ncbi:hypothetical protein A3I36_00345 [Candidatus Giovannonibacteria bacterium RIFCSPLOWO2_02_FULL_45_28]|uniref:DUF4325 domain-containing protein n=2 Tax=Candidatus Giovannoniibacteriota TaxID=1752738 RepID=A0A1F5WAR9_9BACT|nr:MAG: hypothetical protein UW53_C0031G0002 [Candidatus Giovannonibacteria bacterium GW2011_GWA1_44_25]KKU28626.1 MAG: hypothetical protein UX43_C0024G0002 [Candidatus Giovannonibacteria bacterium GW2011_GWB1_46_20]OGF58999.1 MAG: hypothetical protein A2W40_00680 [Candidatus Giovannonibacteria bacterium RIFCSPHIGHO2_01_45_12]OGF60226.1 MAG: hypothetical protein A2656_03685 [Candidatus Giovannonibacteria bacterium RIFCSPHIGHO2_01_FULL_44_100]OGF72733.1 MAG: hypothetical protein A3C05_03115 [Can
MDVKHFILKKLAKAGRVRTSDVASETGFSRAYISRFLQELQNEGKILRIGRANQARYVFAHGTEIVAEKRKILRAHRILKNKNLSEDAVLDEIKRESGIFLKLPKNISDILDYAFTEMLNNAIEHSRSKSIEISARREPDFIGFDVVDRGVGIFNNLMRKKRLKSELEAIQDLLKGKQTTAPRQHTGEGVFFTSKVADILTFKSSNKKLIFDNIASDVFVKDIKNVKGTRVSFFIKIKSKRDLAKVFREFSGDSFEFGKTRVIVTLYKMGESYISRSQARRVLSGLDKFHEIILNFNGVETVGQAFTDEVFRVWQAHHPRIKIKYENANDNIVFMIKRATKQAP